MTTGLAYIYDNEESMKVEPKYIHQRHEGFRSSAEKPAAAEEAAPAEEPAEEEAAEEEAPAEEDAAEEGGDE
ncbi:MAG: hypothetical protein MKZ57_03430 [Candidatus Poseidoniaceae archaeon]|nr:hypothetical protein [Candidatus Poseidoniaceae archaeon]